jgi:hypothetical protein
LGNGQSGVAQSNAPFQVSGALTGKVVANIAASQTSSYVYLNDNSIYWWGSDPMTTVPTYFNVNGTGLSGKTLTSIAVGNGFALVLTSDNLVFGWGSNYNGQLGLGYSGQSSKLYKPAQLNTTLYLPGKTVVSIACGGSHSALLTSDGTIYTFGANTLGQLGDGTTTDRNYPVAVAATGVLSGKTIKYISLGVSQTIVVGSDSKLYGWGSNYQRLLGVSSSTSSFSIPQQTAIYYPQQNNITIASTGYYHTLYVSAYITTTSTPTPTPAPSTTPSPSTPSTNSGVITKANIWLLSVIFIIAILNF